MTIKEKIINKFRRMRYWAIVVLFWRIVRYRFIYSRHLSRIPPNSNPFNSDYSHMGTYLVRDWMVMHEGFDRKDSPLPLRYIIMINIRTGKRILIELPQD